MKKQIFIKRRFITNMIKTVCLLLVFSLMSSCRKDSPSPTQKDEFVKFYGNYLTNIPINTFLIDDELYFFANSQTENGNSVLLLKTDNFGNSILEKSISLPTESTLIQVIQLKDLSGFGLLLKNQDKLQLATIDNSGSILLNNTFSYNIITANCFCEMNNGFALVYSDSISSFKIQFTDSNADSTYTSIKYSFNEVPKIHCLEDNSLLIAANTNSKNENKLIRISEFGGPINASSIDFLISNFHTSNTNDFYLCGSINNKLYYRKVNLNITTGKLETDWNLSYPQISFSEVNQISVGASGTIYITGSGTTNTSSNQDAFVVSLSSDGAYLSTQWLGGEDKERGISTIEIGDNSTITTCEVFYEETSKIGLFK